MGVSGVNSKPYLSERSELRVAREAGYIFPVREKPSSVLVSVTVWYKNPQRYDANHSVVTQFALNPAFWSIMGDPRQICERYSTVSDDVDSFQCHAGV